jgi:hypothetical protein
MSRLGERAGATSDAVRRATRNVSRRATVLAQSRISALDVDSLSASMLTAIDKVATDRWDAAVARAAALPGSVRPEKLDALVNQMARELALAGAAAGAVAAAPTIGTAASLTATAAELAWFTTRAGDLILTIAALHGRPTPTIDERRAWVLAVLIYGGSAREGFNSAARHLGLETGTSAKLPLASLRAVNGTLSRHLLRKYGARRGAVALGTALPAGIGAVVGASANWKAVRALAGHADRFFARLPYSAIDTTGHELPPGLPAPRPA